MSLSRRNRELVFLIPAAAMGALAAASVASARADSIDPGPLPVVAAILVMFTAMHIALRIRAPRADPYMLPIVGALVGLSLAELNRLDPDLARDQAIWVGVGTLVFIATIILVPDPRILERYRYLIGVSAVGLLVITMIFGTTIYGARLWIELPGGQTVQPGELVKVMLVVFFAGYLRDRREVLAIPTQRFAGLWLPPARHLAPLLVFAGAALALVVLLNDFGTALLFFGIVLTMLYVATGRLAYPAAGAVLFAIGSLALYALVPRVQSRVDAWLDPFDDPQGQGYQLSQSLYALADGGLFGPGLGKAFLLNAQGDTIIPFLETDFIFSAVATELGYLGAVAVLLAFLLLVQRGFAIAAGATDGFTKLLAAGLTAAVALQAIVIVGGVVRLIPLTGVTLPFMSYGGSSVVVNFGILALLLAVSHRTRSRPRPAPRGEA